MNKDKLIFLHFKRRVSTEKLRRGRFGVLPHNIYPLPILTSNMLFSDMVCGPVSLRWRNARYGLTPYLLPREQVKSPFGGNKCSVWEMQFKKREALTRALHPYQPPWMLDAWVEECQQGTAWNVKLCCYFGRVSYSFLCNSSLPPHHCPEPI